MSETHDTESLAEFVAKALGSAITMARDGGKNETTVEYHHDGQMIKLPGDPRMSLRKGAERLLTAAAMEEQVYNISEQLPGLPLDAAHAFVMALKERYGWADTKSRTVETFFGSKKVKPSMQRVRTGPNYDDWIEVPIGDFQLPDVETTITTGFERSRTNYKMAAFTVEAEVRHGQREIVMQLINRAAELLKENSIYRGKAMRLYVNDDGEISSMFEPNFIDLSDVDVGQLVLNRDTEMTLSTTLWAPIRNVENCRLRRIPLKRTILLKGPYGTGKSLTASVTARIGIDNRWTFVMVDNVKGLGNALEFARHFQPAIVFAEDIDRVMDERDESANAILNTISGIIGANAEVIVVLTTNHIEKIHKAMLRPGRIDVVADIGRPDYESTARLMRQYAGSMLGNEHDVSAAAEKAAGWIPAAIREAVERTKLYAMNQNRNVVTADDLLSAVVGMQAHIDAMKEDEPTESDEEKLGVAFKQLLLNGHAELQKESHRLIEEIHKSTV